ncbi:MAG: hypothetical protein AB7K37_01715 [Cyclobacteriaceae bacterium]
MKIFHVVLRTVLFVGLFIVGSSLSCSLFDKVDDVTFDIVVEHTFSIDASENDPLSYSKKETIDPSTNSEFAKYKDKIKEITIKSVEYSVENYSGEPGITFSNGKGTFVGTGTSAAASASLAFQDIQASVGQTFQLDYSTAGLDEIGNELENLKKIDFQVSGNLSGVPVAFQVPVTITMTIKADAL